MGKFIKNEDGTTYLTSTRRDMIRALKMIFERHFECKYSFKRFIFKNDQVAKSAYDYITNESMVSEWGYTFVLKGNKIKFKIVELQNTRCG